MTFMILWYFGAFLGGSIPPNVDGTTLPCNVKKYYILVPLASHGIGPYLRINNTAW
jgi:hypothetical protein